jgi:hypothetical protein
VMGSMVTSRVNQCKDTDGKLACSKLYRQIVK